MKINTNLSSLIRSRINVCTIALLGAIVLGSPAQSNAVTPDPVRSWNELALQAVREKNKNDAQAARLYAMLNVAMYDAVNGIIRQHGVRTGREHALIPITGAPPQGDLNTAAAAAAHAVLSGEFPDLQATQYDPQLAADLASCTSGNRCTVGQNWGASVGTQVRTARANDGSTPTESQAPDPDPVGHFRASWSNTQFRNLVPFGIADSSVYFGDGPPPLASLDYAGAFAELKLIGNGANIDQGKLDTFNYWSLGNNTSQPPGAWLQVALAVTSQHPVALPEMTRLFALVTMSMADTVAPTYMTKFVFKHWRPTTAIREANTDNNPLTDPDTTWTSRAGSVGGSPEYWSGHSSFSASAATALTGFYCADNISFTLLTDPTPPNPAHPARTYRSFSAAANEAGQSRVVGGFHFEFSNEEGLDAGRAVAGEILANKLLVRSGPTHFGQCPR